MTPEQKQILRRNWKRILPIGEAAAKLFYDRLFAIDPETRALFRSTDLSKQRAKLLQALNYVVDGLDKLETLLPALEQLGRRHARYGVLDSHYDSVGEALLWTLEQGLGEDWTPAAQAAWTQAYTLIASVMRNATVDIATTIDAPVTVTALAE